MNLDLFAGNSPDTNNAAGGAAYSYSPKDALAQLAVTGMFQDTFYTKAETQLDQLLEAARLCPDNFVAQVAIYARHAGFMKDSPAVLAAYLFGKRSPVITQPVFDKIIDNVKMLSNFVQAVRSGKLGRKSLGTAGKRLINNWLAKQTNDYLWTQSIAKNPSLADVLRLSHPSPKAGGPEREGLFKLLCGKPTPEVLPEVVRQTLAFRENPVGDPPDVPFNMIDSVQMTPAQWRIVAERGGWQFIRMNLNTFARHGLFKDISLTSLITRKLCDEALVRRSRQFPYQILATFLAAKDNSEVPMAVKIAVQEALDISTQNVPVFPGKTVVALDISGSMTSAVGKSVMTCSDVAALFAAALVKRNPTNTQVLVFNDSCVEHALNPLDSVPTLMAGFPRPLGGTDADSVLRHLVSNRVEFNQLIMISDNMSWMEYAGASDVHWREIRRINPGVKQVRLNIEPNATDTLSAQPDVLRVGGFSDAVFKAISCWLEKRDWASTVSAFSG
jgi:60 kDa SS-A/Ro ribonucleoprotein